MENYIIKGHHVTSDKFFTSLNVTNYVMSKQTNFLGTIKKIRENTPTNSTLSSGGPKKIKFNFTKKDLKISCKIRHCHNNKAIGTCNVFAKDVCGKCTTNYEYKITCVGCKKIKHVYGT